jgi:hypothetical protein
VVGRILEIYFPSHSCKSQTRIETLLVALLLVPNLNEVIFHSLGGFWWERNEFRRRRRSQRIYAMNGKWGKRWQMECDTGGFLNHFFIYISSFFIPTFAFVGGTFALCVGGNQGESIVISFNTRNGASKTPFTRHQMFLIQIAKIPHATHERPPTYTSSPLKDRSPIWTPEIILARLAGAFFSVFACRLRKFPLAEKPHPAQKWLRGSWV